MEDKQQEILENLISLYKEMYKAKNLFNKGYFRYSPADVEKAITKALSEGKDVIKKEKPALKQAIIAIDNKEEVEKFYRSKLTYNHSNDTERKKCLDKVTVDDLKHLYYILYEDQPKKGLRKGDIFNLIEKYFETIDRALMLKP
ncbi:hypothetical protein [Clostridium sp. C8-1-8]|uniref:hypothetical protein n=1 Tax=Clostridium sp. C8-1-8 TaxID=2698831 RepID=UPI00136A9E37|nr:hypothetical protein [Clostridium sp. C8-1-8]